MSTASAQGDDAAAGPELDGGDSYGDAEYGCVERDGEAVLDDCLDIEVALLACAQLGLGGAGERVS
ncbi:hypothetical protein H1V43_37485 [Streptomyces sp. PSKA54]|uniref:Uncharacterized protein n=1 Tax=Streptomyces himalayensis subsp. aureolus TaxID=2758039 RepID=A0A7W2HK90_9ACTN|nr:hypothetical protein [Streptomyces himalayensis]MBA4866893.1 hypothetical protein [Streptomyces himalayensis subsp. aureolus]